MRKGDGAARSPPAKRADDLLSQQFRLEGEQRARFDRIRKLSMTACDKRSFLTRAQILRVRELMTKLRQESPPAPFAASPPDADAPAPVDSTPAGFDHRKRP